MPGGRGPTATTASGASCAGGAARRQEDGMLHTRSRAIGILSLGMLLEGSPSWGGPPNPTPSDLNANTAGGSNALESLTSGLFNTAFGSFALAQNTTGGSNTAIGGDAL